MVVIAVAWAAFLVAPSSDLDFWVGKWDVYTGKVKAGQDVVEKSVKGNVAHEFWTAGDGSKGESFFYYMPAQKKWKQVWVTEEGVYKEKYSEPVKDGVRFAGTVFLPDGRTVQDRTTLTRLAGGDVRQVIEWSRDGKAWTVSFDAVYRRSK